MNKELKAKWVEALRSGKYKKTRGTLRRSGEISGGFCCLGVLCDVQAPDKWVPPEEGNYYRHDNEGWGFLSASVKKASGLRYSDQVTLVNMNDDDDAGFTVIANYIEANL